MLLIISMIDVFNNTLNKINNGLNVKIQSQYFFDVVICAKYKKEVQVSQNDSLKLFYDLL